MSYYSGTEAFVGCIFTLIICVIFGAFSGFIFMLLWNWLAPLFWSTAPILTFWQAWGCMILASWLGNIFRSKSK